MTPYENVIDRFERKIKEDKSYFTYEGLTLDEVLEIVNKRSIELLDDAIVEFQPMVAIQQNVDFFNKDDIMEQFKFNLTKVEEDLLSDLMVIKLYEEQSVRLKELQKYLGKDIKVFSPNEERQTFMSMLKDKYDRFEAKVSKYNTIDRNTGKFLLAY